MEPGNQGGGGSGRLLQNYRLGASLGSGGFGVVIRAIKTKNCQSVAIKLIPEGPASNWSAKSVENEAKIIPKIPKHANVVEYFNCWRQQLNRAQVAEVKKLTGCSDKLSLPPNLPHLAVICIEMELCNCNLKSWLKPRAHPGGHSARKSYKIFSQLVDGLEHIHRNNVIHRDLKPTNIMMVNLGNNPVVKIGDFGLAVLHESQNGVDYHTTDAGNALYKAPEQEGNKYGQSADIYALGLILYELFDPNSQANIHESLQFVKFNQKFQNPDLERDYPIVTKLILEMIKYRPEERPNFARIRDKISTARAGGPESSFGGSVQGDDEQDDDELLASLANQFQEDCQIWTLCRGCDGILTDPRYKCCICPNMVLCKHCEDEDGTTTKNSDTMAVFGHAPDHPMLKFKKNSNSAPVLDKNGCKHYRRKCQLHCLTCNEYFWCRLCHDESPSTSTADHAFDRHQVGLIKCTICSTAQIVGKECRKCGVLFAQYFCEMCHLYDDAFWPARIWHCEKCGICRRKPSRDVEYEHCDICSMCYPVDPEKPLGHQCNANAGKSKCGFCGKPIFDSTTPAALVDGNYVHVTCLRENCAFVEAEYPGLPKFM